MGRILEDKTGYFWTDHNQAQQKLTGTVVNYDGVPHYIREVRRRVSSDGEKIVGVEARAGVAGARINYSAIDLEDPKWNKFRSMPRLGWYNSGDMKNAQFLFRTPRRITQHGLSSRNLRKAVIIGRDRVEASTLNEETWFYIFADEGVKQMQKGEYPSLAGTLEHIPPGVSVAISPDYCVNRDAQGVRWLFRKRTIIGLFTGLDTLMLIGRFGYFKEELEESPIFTVNRIVEF